MPDILNCKSIEEIDEYCEKYKFPTNPTFITNMCGTDNYTNDMIIYIFNLKKFKFNEIFVNKIIKKINNYHNIEKESPCVVKFKLIIQCIHDSGYVFTKQNWIEMLNFEIYSELFDNKIFENIDFDQSLIDISFNALKNVRYASQYFNDYLTNIEYIGCNNKKIAEYIVIMYFAIGIMERVNTLTKAYGIEDPFKKKDNHELCYKGLKYFMILENNWGKPFLRKFITTNFGFTVQ